MREGRGSGDGKAEEASVLSSCLWILFGGGGDWGAARNFFYKFSCASTMGKWVANYMGREL